MADEKTEVAPATKAAATPAAAKTLVYAGPTKPVPSIGNLPGLPAFQTKKADQLTPAEIEYVRTTVPAAANWWK